jgi:hypothetical protein
MNALVEAENVVISPSSLEQRPKFCMMPSASGEGQLIARCPRCFTAMWSHYGGMGPSIAFLRTGTLDKRGVDGSSVDDVLRPDVYIFTKHKQPWVDFLGGEGKTFEGYYKRSELWSAEACERFDATRPRHQEWEARGAKWEELGEVCSTGMS